MKVHIIGPAGVGVSTVARLIESSFPKDVFLLKERGAVAPDGMIVVVDGGLHFSGPNRQWTGTEAEMFSDSQCIFLQAPLGTCLKRAKTDHEAVRRLHDEFTNYGKGFASTLTRLGAAVHHVDADRSLRPVIIDVVAHVPVLREKIRHSPQAAWLFPDNNANKLAPVATT